MRPGMLTPIGRQSLEYRRRAWTARVPADLDARRQSAELPFARWCGAGTRGQRCLTSLMVGAFKKSVGRASPAVGALGSLVSAPYRVGNRQ